MQRQPTAFRKYIKPLVIVIGSVLGVVLALYAFAGLMYLLVYIENRGQPTHYETDSIENYGDYPGIAEEYMTNYISRFFPDQILDDFHNVQYAFHRSNVDTYSFEAYLEFTVDSADAFHKHVQEATEGMIQGTFVFDSDYQEFVLYDSDSGIVYDHLQLGREYTEDGITSHQIHYAKIAKILVNYEEQRVIYVALALHDGGGTRTSFLRSYFERFSIDPKEYALYTQTIENQMQDNHQE